MDSQQTDGSECSFPAAKNIAWANITGCKSKNRQIFFLMHSLYGKAFETVESMCDISVSR